jgi:hypothetical protein
LPVRRLVDVGGGDCTGVAALVRGTDPAGDRDEWDESEEPRGQPLGDRSGAAEVADAGGVATLQVVDVGGDIVDVPGGERLERRHRAGADQDRFADLGRRRRHQRWGLTSAADRGAGAGRHVTGGAVQPVQLASRGDVS